MHKSLARLAATVAVGASILGGGVLMAPAANAATVKVHYAAFTNVTQVGSDYHNVRFTARHVGSETTKYDGTLAYKYYSIRIHRGKHDLLTVKKVSLKRAIYMANISYGDFSHDSFHMYKSDKGLVKAEKQALKLPYKTVSTRVDQILVGAREAAVKSDVRNTVNNVSVAQAIGTPDDYVVANSNVKGKETVVVTWLDASKENYTVVGTDGYDHYFYKYDSRTGKFTEGKA